VECYEEEIKDQKLKTQTGINRKRVKGKRKECRGEREDFFS
jgi:hypothetical protein